MKRVTAKTKGGEGEVVRPAGAEMNDAVLNSLTAHIVVLDRDGVILAVNEAWRRFADENKGGAADAVPHTDVGTNYLEVCRAAAADKSDECGGAVYEGLKAVLDGTRDNFALEYPCHSPIDERWFLLNANPLPETGGAVVSHLNITDRRRAEAELREQKEVLETVNRIGHMLAAELDQQNLVQAVTDAATELTGAQFGAFFYNVLDDEGGSYLLYTLSGVDREHFAKFPMPRATELFGPTFRGEGTILIPNVREDARFGKNDPYYGMPEGHLPVTSYLAVPVISRSGEVLGGLFFGHPEANRFRRRDARVVEGLAAQAAVAMDNARLVNSLRRERSKLQESEEQFRMMADAMPQLAWMAEADGHIFWYNRRWYDYTGTTPGEMEGWGWQSVHDPQMLPRVVERWRASIETGNPFEMEFPLKGADGAFRWFLTRVNPLRDSQGRIVRWFGTNTDVEGQKRMEEQLARLNREREQMLEEVSTPIVPVWRGVLVMPIIGTLDIERMRRAMEAALSEVTRTGARACIIDITGARIVDTHAVINLSNLVSALKLIGAEAIVTGVNAHTANTLVRLGVDFTGMRTQRTLAEALASIIKTQQGQSKQDRVLQHGTTEKLR